MLAPALAFSIVAFEHGQQEGGTFSKPVAVEPGTSLEYGGAIVGPADARFDDTVEAPAGARVLSVTVRIDPQGQGFTCGSMELFERGGAQRQWNESSSSLDLPYDPDVHAYCSDDETEPYDLSLHYLVPDDATGPFTVQIENGSAAPEFASVVVVP